MFHFGKKENKKTSPSEPVLPTDYNMPVHTMQDDLNVLEGLKPSQATNYHPPENRPNQYSQTPPENRSMAPEKKSYSPFLNGPASKQDFPKHINPLQDYAPQPLPPKPTGQKMPIASQNNGSKWGKILIIGTAVMAFLALAAGGYYFWMTRQSSDETTLPENNNQEEITPQPGPPIVIEPPQEKYSLLMPNYLMVDEGSTNLESIKSLILNTSKDIKDLNASQPVEFVIVDKNNNPISFSTFAVTCGLNFSPVLENLNESFSFFLFDDSGNTRLGLAINIKDKPKAVIAMAEKEKTVTEDLSFLFLDSAPQKPTDAIFKTFNGSNYAIRYLNYDPQNTGSLSFDYALIGDKLVIATSKNTMMQLVNKFVSSF